MKRNPKERAKPQELVEIVRKGKDTVLNVSKTKLDFLNDEKKLNYSFKKKDA